MALELNFVTDDVDLLVLVILFASIYPKVWHMRLHFFIKQIGDGSRGGDKITLGKGYLQD